MASPLVSITVADLCDIATILRMRTTTAKMSDVIVVGCLEGGVGYRLEKHQVLSNI